MTNCKTLKATMFVVLTGNQIYIWDTQQDTTNEGSTVKKNKKKLKFTETKMRLALY